MSTQSQIQKSIQKANENWLNREQKKKQKPKDNAWKRNNIHRQIKIWSDVYASRSSA